MEVTTAVTRHSLLTLLLPAIALVNRLSFSKKFLLLGSISLLALSVALYGYYNKLDQIISTSKKQIKGVELAVSLFKIIQQVQRHRGLSAGTLGGSTNFGPALAKSEHEIEDAFLVLENRLPAGSEQFESCKDLRAKWNNIQAHGLQMAPNNNFSMHTQLIERMLEFRTSLADDYSLTTDSDLDVFYLTHASLNEFIEILEHLAQIRGFGSGILARKTITDLQRPFLISMIENADDAYTRLKKSLDKVARFNPEMREFRSSSNKEISQLLLQLKDEVRSDILTGRFTSTPVDFFSMTSKTIDRSYLELTLSLLPQASKLIQNRIKRTESEIRALVGIGTLFVLLLAYFMAAIYYATIHNINLILKSTTRFAHGDMHGRVQLETNDELAQIGHSFNKMADEIQKSYENLRISASVFESSLEAITISDANNNIIDINPAFTKITGYSREEAIGKNPKLLSSGLQDKAFYATVWQSLNRDRAWRGEIWNRRKSGEIYPEILSISVICDIDDKVLRYVAVFTDISQIKKHEAELSHAANYDVLTGIPNRLLLSDRMNQGISKTSREQNLMAVCYLDLDDFKSVNDKLGHEAGDQLLIEVANRISNILRGDDTVARLGGDEFIILLLALNKLEDCVMTLERLLISISQPFTVKGAPLTISASIGVSIYPSDDANADTLLRHADQAMYVAKQSGKNSLSIYNLEMDRLTRERNEFLKTFRRGLEQNQFELYYQPKVNLRTKELVGAEALIRWRHPERGLLSPAEFLRHIENTAMDIALGEWVTATALAQMDVWRSAGLDIEVSINISGYHLESSGFLETLIQQLADHPDILPGKLQIEVLETIALKDIGIVREIIESCRKIGVGFALDDFGTRYSSLVYLSRLPVDTLKIDQSFVRDMLEDKGDMAIVLGIIALARAFDRHTVAEGVETKEHFQALLDMACELGQGYYIARPMPANELPSWRANHLF